VKSRRTQRKATVKTHVGSSPTPGSKKMKKTYTSLDVTGISSSSGVGKASVEEIREVKPTIPDILKNGKPILDLKKYHPGVAKLYLKFRKPTKKKL
jgi:hypothetical protein